MLLVEETSLRTHTTASMASDLPHRWCRCVRADGGPSASRMVCGSSRGHIPLRDRRRGHTPLREAAFNLEAEPRFRVCVLRVDGRYHTHKTCRASCSPLEVMTQSRPPQVVPQQGLRHGRRVDAVTHHIFHFHWLPHKSGGRPRTHRNAPHPSFDAFVEY